MRIERNIISNLPAGEVRQKAARHLIAQRYRLINDGVEMKFERGTVLRSIFSFSVGGSVVQAYLRPKQVGANTEMTVVFIITNAGRVVRRGEQAVWEEELNQLETAITGIAKPKAAASPNETKTLADENAEAEYSDAVPRPLSAPVQSQVALIFATLAALFCVSIGWVIGHSWLSAALGLIIGVGAAFLLVGAWMSRFETDEAKADEAKADEPKALDENEEGTKPQ